MQQSRVALCVLALGLLACNAVLGIDKANYDPSFRARESCVLNSDCSHKSQVCIFRVCSPPCARDVDCTGGQECLRATNGMACVNPKDRMCQSTKADCPAGTTCSMGSCQTVCATDDDCTADQHCEQKQCTQRVSEAGVRDATVPDASAPRDASIDASQPHDAGDAASGDGSTTHEAGPTLGTTSDKDAGDAAQAHCHEGDQRCVGSAQSAREKCEHGDWTADAPCPTGQLCDTSASPAGQCADVKPECVGASPGVLLCSGAKGTVCGPDLVTTTSMTCKSAQHCALGMDGNCAACLTGEYKCQNNDLMRCNDRHDGFDKTDTCTTTSPCNAEAGACTALTCLPNNKRCNGDELQQCNSTQSGWDHLQTCDPNLCDAINFECDVCTPGNSCKDGTTRYMCSSDGQTRSELACPGDAPHCTGAGTCAQCTQTPDCTAPDSCHTATCNVGSGQCEYPRLGTNVQCSGGGGYCNASDQCVSCTLDSHCSASTECFSASCGNGSCHEMAKDPGIGCSNNRVCDGAGQCVACVSTTQCSAGGECYTATCNSNVCGRTANGRGTLCASGTRYCDGSGVCVQCTATSQCASTEVCRADACANAVHTIGGETSSGTTSSLLKDWLYLRRLPALAHGAVMQNFGVIGTGTGASLKMALYADNGSGTAPTGTALNQTPTAIGLANTARLGAPSVPNLALSAGTIYWLGFMPNVGTDLKAQAVTGQQGIELPNGYTNPFPMNPSGTASNGVLEAVYITVQDSD